MIAVRYAEIDGFPGYSVSDDGRIQSCHRKGTKKFGPWRDLRPGVDSKGYLGLTICSITSGKRWKVRVHRLVAAAFIPNPNVLPCVRHLDGNSQRNSASNLAWGSYADNEADKKAHGTWNSRFSGKLTAADRLLARSLHANGISPEEIAADLGVCRQTITRLIKGSTWRGLP